jgi:NTE family protein
MKLLLALFVHSSMKIHILLICLLSQVTLAQPIKNLVFEGGGMRGVSYAGALAELDNRGLLDSLQRVGGTSVGAITAMMVALGYSPTEIEHEIARTNPNKFNDGTVLFFGGPTRLRKQYGWYKGNKVSQWIGGLIENKVGNASITFAQLKQLGKPVLYVTGTSLNNQQVLIFSHESYPNMKVRDAVRASMSIPFFFKPIIIDSVGSVLKRPNYTNHDIVVDGGFIANYPIDLFDAIDSSGNRIPNPATLGFRLDTGDQLDHDRQKKSGLAPWPILTFRNYVGAFFNYIMENLNRPNLTEADWDRTIAIRSSLVGAKIKKLTSAQQAAMMHEGQKAVINYLENH